MVSGVNSVPISSSTLRPKTLPLTAKRRRWSSLSRILRLPTFLFQDLVFGAQVVDDFLLLAVHPAGEDDQQKLPRLQDEVHVDADEE